MEWWPDYISIENTACINVMLSSISMSKTGIEAVTTGCGLLKPHSRIRRDCSLFRVLFYSGYEINIFTPSYTRLSEITGLAVTYISILNPE